MGMFDKVKGLLRGNKGTVKGGIDKVADTAGGMAGGHADKVDKAADMAKDTVDKITD